MEGRPAEPGNEDGPEERSVEEGAGEERTDRVRACLGGYCVVARVGPRVAVQEVWEARQERGEHA